MDSEPSSKVRLGPIAFPQRWEVPPRPATGPAAVLDTYRQTRFLLAEDLDLLQRSMNLQLAIVAASARLRTPQALAMLGLWSRAFAYLSGACDLLARGSYASCIPLLRAACDSIAAQRALTADGFREFTAWLARAVSQEREHTALAIELGRFRAASVLAEEERLAFVYRVASELSMPHFGATVLQTGPETGLQRFALAFAEGAFHLGWAELILGWLLTLADVQLESAAGCGALAVPGDAYREYGRLRGEIQALLASVRRCRVEEVDDGYLFRNFRRTASSTPRRILLRRS